jgi:hypothetical protein
MAILMNEMRLVHPVVLAQRSLSFIFLNVADFKGIRRGQDLREAQTDFET